MKPRFISYDNAVRNNVQSGTHCSKNDREQAIYYVTLCPVSVPRINMKTLCETQFMDDKLTSIRCIRFKSCFTHHVQLSFHCQEMQCSLVPYCQQQMKSYASCISSHPQAHNQSIHFCQQVMNSCN